MGSWGREDTWQGHHWWTMQSHISLWINWEEQQVSDTDLTTQGSIVCEITLRPTDVKTCRCCGSGRNYQSLESVERAKKGPLFSLCPLPWIQLHNAAMWFAPPHRRSKALSLTTWNGVPRERNTGQRKSKLWTVKWEQIHSYHQLNLNKQKLSTQVEQQQNQRNGHYMEHFQWWWGGEKWGEGGRYRG